MLLSMEYWVSLVASVEVVRVAMVVALFLVLSISIEGWYRWCHPPVELSRKAAHVASGTLSALFPWIFSSTVSVAVLAVAMLAYFGIARRKGMLGSVFGVERHSRGDLYFVMSVLLLFSVSIERPIFYFVSIMTLTLADALAALVGSTYQRVTYEVRSHRKSLEGSVIFFMATFLVIHLPLLLFTDVGRGQCVAMAALIALVVACIEAISIDGFDNLLVPVSTYLLLLELWPLSAGSILYQLAGLMIVIAGVYIISWTSGFLSIGGVLCGQLALYAMFSLGGTWWLLGPVVAAVAFGALYVLLKAVHPNRHGKIYQVRAVFYIALTPALLTLVQYNLFSEMGTDSPIYPLFVSAIAAHLAIACYRLLWLHRHSLGRTGPNCGVAVFLSLAAWALVVPGTLWLSMAGLPPRLEALQTVAIVGPAMLLFYVLYRYSPWPLETPWQFRLQAFSVAVVVVAVFVASYYHLLLL